MYLAQRLDNTTAEWQDSYTEGQRWRCHAIEFHQELLWELVCLDTSALVIVSRLRKKNLGLYKWFKKKKQKNYRKDYFQWTSVVEIDFSQEVKKKTNDGNRHLQK